MNKILSLRVFKKQSILSILLIIFLFGCAPQLLTEDSRPQTVEVTPTVNHPVSTATKTPLPTPTVVPATETLSSPQHFDELNAPPSVTITAVGGNLYIRRGPSTKYSRIGVLTKGMTAEVIGRDVLSKWVQINIPDSEFTGWISMLTEYEQIDGDLSQIPDFTFTDYPVPAYVENCTEHLLLVQPGEYYLENVFTAGKYLNEVKLDPGVYTIYDITLPDEPKLDTIDLQEGETAYIMVDGLGVSHLCP